jgi:hypothetical protein
MTEFSEVRLKGVLRSSGLPFGWFVSVCHPGIDLDKRRLWAVGSVM